MADAIPASPYEGLLFSYPEMVREIESMRELARRFLHRADGEARLREWKGKLESFRRGSQQKTLYVGYSSGAPGRYRAISRRVPT